MERKIHGYRVILHQTNVEEVKVESVVNAGFLQETRETSGINHLLEHVLTSSWARCAPNCSAYFSDRGITMNASTDFDYMTYHVTGLPKEVDKMISYICQISDHPIMHAKTLKDEKEAVKDEMLAFGADPAASLIMKFNHAFYKNGMQFKDDWQLQIDNLKRLELADLKRAFKEEFNTGSVTFLISGKFDKASVISTFTKCLVDRPLAAFTALECLTYAHEIIFDRADVPTCTLLVGFPSKNRDSVMAMVVCELLKSALFEILRTKLKLVYGVRLEQRVLTCGTQCVFEISVQPERLVEVTRVLFQTLRKYKSEPFNKKQMYAMKTNMLRQLNSSLPNLDILADQVSASPGEKVMLRTEVFEKVRDATPAMLKEVVKLLFVPEDALIAYQGRKDMHLSWPKLQRSQTKRVNKNLRS